MNNDISKRIQDRASEKGLTSSDIGLALGVSQHTASQWMQGDVKPRYKNLLGLCDLLDVTYSWLMTGECTDRANLKSEDASLEAVSSRIKQRMRELKLRGTDLEGIVNASNSTISQWVRGINYPSAEKIPLLADTLQCTEEWLMYGLGDSPDKPNRGELVFSAPPEKMHLSERITVRMEHLGIRAVDIAKNLGVGKAAVSQWTRGAVKPSGQNLVKLAGILGCTPEWILTGRDKGNRKEVIPECETDMIDHSLFLESFSELLDSVDILPLVTSEELKALKVSDSLDYSQFFSSEMQTRVLRFARSSLEKIKVKPDRALCVKINVPAMEPVFPPNTTIGINLEGIKIVDGRTYAFWHYDTFRAAKLYNLPDGGIRISNFNAEYPDEYLEGEKANNVALIGHIFWYSVLLEPLE